jgi:hypothetical protein
MRPALSRSVSVLFLLLLPLCAWQARAHEFKLDIAMNGFVRIERNEAHLVIRAPLFLFKAIRFPVKGAEIDIEQSGPTLARTLEAMQRDVTIFEDGRPLQASSARGRLTLPSDKSFQSFDSAARHVATPLEPGTAIMAEQGYVDAHFTFPIASPDAVFAVRTAAGPEFGDYLKVTIRYEPLRGDPRALVLTSRSGTVELNPTWISAAIGFVGIGVAHIVTGFDHLLFLLCLVIPLRGVRQILIVVTGFTLAHSFTLIGSAFDLAPSGAWFPPFVETIIALSVVYMALENIVGVDLRRRVLLTMLFGLVHGFGFSYGLRQDLQFAGTHLLVALFAFNVGIEIGQILVLAVMLPLLALVQRYVLPGRVGAIILSALVAHIGWHWMTERWEALATAPWPSLDAANAIVLLLWLAGLFVGGGLIVAIVSRLRLDSSAPARPAVVPSRAAD